LNQRLWRFRQLVLALFLHCFVFMRVGAVCLGTLLVLLKINASLLALAQIVHDPAEKSAP
jgi:hypothetical protein